MLHGPAEAGNYRVKIGRYGDRWYTDPLPGCDVAPASEWHGPSVSTTKPPFANKYYTLRGIADMPSAEWARLAGLDAEERYEAVKAADKTAGRINMSRGSIVHRWAEDRLAGRTPIPGLDIDDPKALAAAERFRPALEQFFDHYQPEAYAVEAVCLNRSLHDVGYGGTMDALVKIDGELWVVDWKSRNSDHAAYLEEAAQGGAYLGADYMIVASDDGAPKRVKMPDVAGVLIVSIREDGYRAFPIDKDGAVETYHAMHAWWCAQRAVTDRKVIGRPWAPRSTAPQQPPASPDKRASIIDRIRRLIDDGHGEALSKRWPQDVPGFKTAHPHTDAEIDQVHAVVQRLEDEHGYGFHPDDYTPEPDHPVNTGDCDECPRGCGLCDLARGEKKPPAATAPDDGQRVSVAARDELNAAYAALGPTQRADVDRLRSELPQWATPPGCGPYLRHWEILRTAVLWAEAGWDDDVVRDLTAAVSGDDAVRQPGVPIGTAWAALTIAQAVELAELARRVLDGTHLVIHHDRWTLEPAA